MAGSGGCCSHHLPTHSLSMLCWGSSRHDGQVPRTSNQEEAGKSCSTSHDLPWEVTGGDFCQSHQPRHIRKEGTKIPPFGRTRVKNHIVRRTHGMGEVAVVVFGKSNQLHLTHKVKIILLESLWRIMKIGNLKHLVQCLTCDKCSVKDTVIHIHTSRPPFLRPSPPISHAHLPTSRGTHTHIWHFWIVLINVSSVLINCLCL